MTFFLALGRFLGGNLWRTLALALLAVALGQTIHAKNLRGDLDGCRKAREIDHLIVADATQRAKAADLQHALKVERDNARIAQEKQHELESQLAAARGVAARYASLHPAPQADPGRSGTSGEPGVADPARGTDEAGAQAVVPAEDLTVCAENTILAEGWQEWWQSVSQAARDAEGQ